MDHVTAGGVGCGPSYCRAGWAVDQVTAGRAANQVTSGRGRLRARLL